MKMPNPAEVAKGERERSEESKTPETEKPMTPSERYNILLRGANVVHGLGDLPGRGTVDASEAVSSLPPVPHWNPRKLGLANK
jgi:hypothetical protein